MSLPLVPYDSPKLTPLKQNNLEYAPAPQQIFSYAEQVLKISLTQDKDLIFLAEEALKAPLPPEWEACEYLLDYQGIDQSKQISEDSTVIVYRNKKTRQVVYDHPLDEVYRDKARQLKLMKNTAKYTEYVSPINEELIESSVLLLQKNNSKKLSQGSISNQSSLYASSNISESRSRAFNPSNLKASDFVRNITEQSMIYDEDQSQFQNVSMITDKKENENRNKIDLKNLTQNQKQIQLIILPNQNQKLKKKKKEEFKQKANKQFLRQTVKKIIYSGLINLNQTNSQYLKERLTSLTLKQMEEKMTMLRQYPDQSQILSSQLSIRSSLDLINEKISQLKRIQRQNNKKDQQIKQMIKMIELEKRL